MSIVNNAAVSIHMWIFVWIYVFIFLEEPGLLGCSLNLDFKFKEIAELLSKLAEPFYPLTSNVIKVPASPYSHQCLLLFLFLL